MYEVLQYFMGIAYIFNGGKVYGAILLSDF